MKVRWWTVWLLAGAITLALGPGEALAQRDEVPILKPRPKQAATATLLVMCDLACNLKLDGETKGRIDAGGSAKEKVALGQHALVAVTDDGLDKVQKDIEIKTAGQTIFRVVLQPVRNDRLQAQQDTDPVYLRDHAAERAKEGQKLYDQHLNVEAKPLVEKACSGGSMAGCITLGAILEDDNGILTDRHGNLIAARSLYQKACDSEVMLGCTRLGMTYDLGDDSDYNKASNLFQKACDGGDMWGCNNLAGSYLMGKGEPKDRSRALGLYQRACSGGFDWACHNLSELQYSPQ
jgi:hypothetical protein